MDNNPSSIDAEKLLSSVAEEHSFRLKNGGSISSLRQLYSALQSMEESVFNHHVSGERHDFGNWVKDVHKDYRLANSLFSASDKNECARSVGSRIYELEKLLDGQKNSVVVIPEPAARKEVIAPKEKAAPLLKADSPLKKKEDLSGKEGGFNREVEIAKAILERKPITYLLEPRKNKESTAPSVPVPAITVEKSELETAAERLEKILSDAAKAKIDDNRQRKLDEKKPESPVEESISNIRSPSESFFESENEPLFCVSPIEKDGSDNLIRLIEQKSFAGQLKSDIISIFSKSSVKEFTEDMKSIAPTIKRNAKVISADEGSEKDRIISHLKRVYK